MAGRKREYETIYILRPDITNEVIGQVQSPRFRGVSRPAAARCSRSRTGASASSPTKCKKQMKGIYLFFSYLGAAGLVEEVERNLRLTDTVIRYSR